MQQDEQSDSEPEAIDASPAQTTPVRKPAFRSRKLTGQPSEREKQIRMIQALGYAVFTLFIGVNVFSEPLRDKWLSGDIPGLATKFILILVVLCLVFLWFESSTREFDSLNDWASLDHTTPPTAVHEALIVTAVSLFLGGLLYAIQIPVYFAYMFTAYALMDMAVQKYVVRHIYSILDKSQNLLAQDLQATGETADSERHALLMLHDEALKAMARYYRHDFQWWRRMCIFIASVFLLVLSHFARSLDSPMLENYVLIGYATLIICGELVIFVYRRTMISAIKDVVSRYPTPELSS